MKQWSIRAQMILGILALIGGMSLLFSGQGFFGMNRLIGIHRETVADELARTVRARIAILLRSADMGLEPILADERIRNAFSRRDREALQKLLTPVWPALKAKGIVQLQFHVPPATSFLRMHDTSKYGDDLSSFRATVVKANAEKKPVQGLEEGRGGFGLRVVRPVLDSDGSFLGTVEFGLDFGKKFLDDLKADYPGEYFLYRFADRDVKAWKAESSLLGATEETDPVGMDRPPVSTDWAEGHVVEYRSGNRLVVLIPVADYSGQYVGLVKAHVDLSAFDHERNILAVLFLGTGLLGAALGVGFGIFLIGQAFKPLQRCTELTESIAKGDLTVGLDHSRTDEIGAIYRSLNNMRDGLAGLLRNISKTITETTGAAKGLEVGTAEVTLAAQQVSSTMEQVATDSTNLNELARKSREAAVHLEKSAAEVGSAAQRTREESAAVLEASRKVAGAARMSSEMIGRISSLMSHSAESVRILGSSLENVREFAASIQNISDEINLLSLNASIEAARAGEAGRGFAVVAQHVSRLADQSSQAVADIHRTIEDILKEADQTSDAIIAGNKEMEEGSKGVREALGSVSTIEGMLEKVDAFVETITQAAGRQTTDASLVANSMEKVSDLIEDSVAATEEVAASMEQITGLMVSLKKEAEHLSTMARDISEEASIFKS